jgi:hypothetical protein
MSSYNSPLPQGSPEGTGAYAVAIAETAGGTNNNGNATDSAGNVKVDFVWDSLAMQPNDERTSTADFTTAPSTVVVAANASQNYGWSGYTVYPSSRLNPTLSDHAIAEAAYAGFPANASGDGAYISGVAYIKVPNVLGLTTALAIDALRDAGYEAGNITTATAATNARTDVTRFDATSATVAYIFATNAHTNYPVGTKVTLVAGTPAGEAPVNLPTYAIGTWTVTGSAASGQITVSGSGFTVANTTGINSTANLAGLAGTLKTQSTAAGAGSIASTATITVTPWAAAS